MNRQKTKKIQTLFVTLSSCLFGSTVTLFAPALAESPFTLVDADQDSSREGVKRVQVGESRFNVKFNPEVEGEGDEIEMEPIFVSPSHTCWEDEEQLMSICEPVDEDGGS